MRIKQLLSINHSHDLFLKIAGFLLYVCAATPIIQGIVSGGMPFWYDPARDLLLALDNLKKITLIGPPSGIPGIFYGPYWIWLLSLPLLISRDPRVVALFVLDIPYLVLFPILLLKFKHFNSWGTRIITICLFLFSYQRYGIFLWNPHLAPFLFFLLFFELFSLPSESRKRFLIAGLIVGTLVMFHISFGVGILAATSLYLFFESLGIEIAGNKKITRKAKSIMQKLTLFVAGVGISFFPFLVFEFRHGWMQVRSYVTTATGSLLYDSSVVTLNGLTQKEIIGSVWKIPQTLFGISSQFFGLSTFIFLAAGILLLHIFKSKKITVYGRMMEFLSLSFVMPLAIYLVSKNPVWDYHFIGFEAVFLLMTAVFSEKIKILRYVFVLWIFYLAFISAQNTIRLFGMNPLEISGLASKENAVRIIAKDSGDIKISYFAYSPSIYTFDYDYLFRWLMPDRISSTVQDLPIYLIIPVSSEAITDDFINYRTPVNIYRTEKRWDLDDGTMILKRVKTSP